jgi:hypothetical protein
MASEYLTTGFVGTALVELKLAVDEIESVSTGVVVVVSVVVVFLVVIVFVVSSPAVVDVESVDVCVGLAVVVCELQSDNVFEFEIFDDEPTSKLELFAKLFFSII